MDTLTVVHLETFEVSPMLQEVVSTITPLVAKNGNRLEVRCAEGLGALQADLTKVRQALFNLLSNACKFTSSGVITLAVVRERVAGANWLHFGVEEMMQATDWQQHSVRGTRVGTLELRVPQDRGGRFSTELFERW